MRFLFIILILATFLPVTSCNDWSKGKFHLTNNTDYLIDSIRIMPDRQLGKNYISLKPNETKKYTTDMSGSGTDGLYVLEYIINGDFKSKMLGYYSNGASVEKLIKLHFQADTVKVEMIY